MRAIHSIRWFISQCLQALYVCTIGAIMAAGAYVLVTLFFLRVSNLRSTGVKLLSAIRLRPGFLSRPRKNTLPE